MGNTSSHTSGGPTPDHPSAGPTPAMPPGMAGRERSDTGRASRSERDRDRAVPALPPSPPPPPTPLLMPYAGHLSPQNPHCLSHPQAHDYSKTAVTTLILDGQLAPFYRGLDDFEEDWTEDDVVATLAAARDRDYADDVNNSYTQRLKEEREGDKQYGSPEDKAERARREAKAYLGAVECPICFLNYPPNINTSRCCQQPLCTECFVQIKRGEPTTTHLESEPACCPYCVESDFGVIYERPTPASTPLAEVTLSGLSQNALATSPEAEASGFSMSLDSAAGGAGAGALLAPSPSPKPSPSPTPRRKSVSSKAKEVVTIDQIRPDWETKLNQVKAAAARRAARRIVMRQVGDRLIPIGYTSSRATGQADFSMSLPPEEGRRPRRTRDRERELEEMMIMEAMRLSMIDHEEHQRKMADEEKNKTTGGRAGPAGAPTDGGPLRTGASPQPELSSQTALVQPPGLLGQPGPSFQAGLASQARAGSSTSSSRRSSSAGATLSSWRASQSTDNGAGGGRAQAAASKLLSKITVNRSRENSKSSVHFAPSPTTMGASNSGSQTPSSGNGESSTAATRNRSCSSPPPVSAIPALHSRLSPEADAPAASRHSVDVPMTTTVAAAAATAPAADAGANSAYAPLVDVAPTADATTSLPSANEPPTTGTVLPDILMESPTTIAPSFLAPSSSTPPAAAATTGAYMPVMIPNVLHPSVRGDTTPDAAATSGVAALPAVPTAANPHPELAALISEAVDDNTPATAAAATPRPVSSIHSVSQNTSASDLVSSRSSLVSTPPARDAAARVPLSSLADADD